MMNSEENQEMPAHVKARSGELFEQQLHAIRVKGDRMFAVLMIAQWLFAMLFAFTVSPRTWEGQTSQPHIHLWSAILLGGLITLFPVILAITRSGHVLTRQVVTVGQFLMSALLIHLTAGRIETHFHVFGSLAFIAVYRDWRLLVTATVVVGLDHFLRGIYWPQSVYGVLSAAPWRSIEHTAWVLFEDIVLFRMITFSLGEMRGLADRQALLEDNNANTERVYNEVLLQTAELQENEERFHAIVASSPFGIMQIDQEGRCLYVNQRCQALSGKKLDQFIGEGWLEVIHPEEREQIKKLAMDSGSTLETGKFRLAGASGDWRSVQVRASQLRNQDGEIAGGRILTIEEANERKA